MTKGMGLYVLDEHGYGPEQVGVILTVIVFEVAGLVLEGARPGTRSVRNTPRILMLYLMQGIFAAAQFLIIIWTCSMSRSRRCSGASTTTASSSARLRRR